MNKKQNIRIIYLLLLLIVSWAQPVNAMPVFTDIKGHWAQEAVLESASCDLIKGYADKSFKPEQALTELEALVLFMKTQGYALDKVTTAKKNINVKRNPNIPVVPWGQNYIDTAFANQLLPPAWISGFSYNKPATREQVAFLLGRLLNLPSGEEFSAGEQAEFVDLTGLSAETQGYIYSLNQNGIMSGFSNGKFHPQQPLKRSEAAVLLVKLMQGNWVKTSASLDSRQLEGWVKKLSMTGKKPELELASLQGVQTLKLDPGLKCFRDGKECFYQEAVNCQVRLYLDQKKQVTVISLLEKIKTPDSQVSFIGTVKSVALGEDSRLVVYDLNGKLRNLALAREAGMESLKSQSKGFQNLKSGSFVKVYTSNDEVVRVTELKTLSISGTVMNLSDRTLYLEDKATKVGKPSWINYWDRARIIDKNGILMSSIKRGDKVKITYLDPISQEIDDEIPLEITVSPTTDLKQVKGEIQKISKNEITIKKNKEYRVDDKVVVLQEINGAEITLDSLQALDKIAMYVDGAGVVMKVILILKEVKGEVESVTSNSIFIKTNKEYKVDASAKIFNWLNGSESTLSNLKAGEKIVMYTNGAGVVKQVIRDLDKVKGEVESVSSSRIIIKPNKEYKLDSNVKVFNETNGSEITLNSLKAKDKIELYVDSSGVVMKVILLS